MSTDTQKLFSSTTIQGNILSLVGLVGTVLVAKGILPAGTQEAVAQAVGVVISAAGSILSIWGRLNPKIKPITK